MRAGLLLFTGLVALSGCAVPGPSGPVAVFRQAGLFGTWAVNCHRPASTANPYATWTAVGDTIEHTVDFGPRRPRIVDQVGAARIIRPGMVEIASMRGGQLYLTATLMEQDGRLYAYRSVGADGHVYYDHGIQLSNGKPALRDERCLAVAARE